MGIFDKILGKKGDELNIDPAYKDQSLGTETLGLSDFLAPSAMKVAPKNLYLGEKIARSFFVVSYPSDLSDNWLTPIINMDSVFDISIYVSPIDTSEMLRKFQKKVAEIQSQINEKETRGLVRDPALEAGLANLEDLRTKLTEAQEKLFDVGLYMTIYGETEDELEKLENEIKSMLESKMIIIKPTMFQQEDAFKTNIPLANDLLATTQKLNSEPLASFFPFVSFDLSSEDGILYGINRHNSSLIIFDRFKFANYNSITFATSGAGKSFATKLEILRSLMFDINVIIIDPEREYETLCSATGGRYFNISLSSENHINPFDLPLPREDESPADVLRSNIINLVGLFRIMLGGLTPEEDSIIDKAIVETYALKDITPDTDWRSIEPPLLTDLETVLSGIDGTKDILARLAKYTQGSWSTFLNTPSNVDINKQFVVFSVRDMEDELKPVAMYIVTHFIWNEVRKEIRKRLLVVDEAWWMMKSDDTASFLYSIAKRGRKYYLGLMTITQDVSDFMKSSYGAPIVTNSSIQLLLKQHPSAMEQLQKVFNLTEEEKYLLLECNPGEGIFFAGLSHVAIKIDASEVEKQIITTDPAELLAIKRKMKKIFSITITILFMLTAKPTFAQVDNYNVYGPSDISYELNPKNPAPGQSATITLSSFAIDINRSTITWIIGGQNKLSGVGEKILKFTTPIKDDSMTITAEIHIPSGESVTKQIIISTKNIDVLWEVTDGYAPPFYKGKILPTSESRIKVSAIPNSNGSNNYITKWKINSAVLNGGSSVNKMSLEYKNSYLNKNDEISLDVGDMSGAIGGTKLLYIPIQEPQILFYKIDGILGTLYNKSLNSMIDMTTNNIKISAEPYFFAPRNIRDGQLTFNWMVNGEQVDTPKKKNILGFELSDNKSGRAEIGLKIESIPKLMLSKEVKIPVNINIK